MPVVCSTLAQSSPLDAVPWLLLVLVVVILLFVAVVFIRRYLRTDDGPSTPSAPFALGDLRALVKQGKLTEEEFGRLKAQIAEKLKPTTLSLGDVRQMLKDGQIGLDEFERLKAQVMAAMKDPTLPYPERPKPKDPPA